MRPAIQIVSADQPFAELLRAKLHGWGLCATLGDELLISTIQAAQDGKLDLLLLDIRQEADLILQRLAEAMTRLAKRLDVILINKPDDIRSSIEGMRLGATEELTTPLDATALHRSILAVITRQRQARNRSAPKSSIGASFAQAMAAATFAQAGEFDTAMEFMDTTDTTDRKADNQEQDPPDPAADTII